MIYTCKRCGKPMYLDQDEQSLVELGVLKDDNYKIIPQFECLAGEIDKNNPHCELEIIHVEV